MTDLPRVLHLVDDNTAGGVMRVINYLLTSPELASHGHHRILHVMRGKITRQVHQADLIVSHLSISWRNLPVLIAARDANASTPIVHVEHSYTEAFVALNVTNRSRFTTLIRTAFSLFDRIVAVSHAQAAWISKRDFCRADKVVTIQSCVDLSALRALPAPSGRPRVFGAIGRLEPQKGFDTLIKAFRARTTQDTELHIYGAGHEDLNLRNLAAGDQAIVFKGHTGSPETAYRDVDVVLMPSRWEAYGLVAVEALSAGRPVFCASTDGMRDHADIGATLVDSNVVTVWTAVMEAAQRPTAGPYPPQPLRNSNILEQKFERAWNGLVSELCQFNAPGQKT